MPKNQFPKKKRNGNTYVTKKEVRKIVNEAIDEEVESKGALSSVSNLATVPIVNAATLLAMYNIYKSSSIGQGTFEYQRVGNEIHPTFFSIALTLNWRAAGLVPTSADPMQDHVRVLIIRWYENTQPLLGEVLSQDATVPFIGQKYNPLEMKTKRFYVLHDKVYPLNFATPSKHLNLKFPLIRGGKVTYSGGADEFPRGNIYIWVLNDCPVTRAAANLPDMTAQSSVWFKDA